MNRKKHQLSQAWQVRAVVVRNSDRVQIRDYGDLFRFHPYTQQLADFIYIYIDNHNVSMLDTPAIIDWARTIKIADQYSPQPPASFPEAYTSTKPYLVHYNKILSGSIFTVTSSFNTRASTWTSKTSCTQFTMSYTCGSAEQKLLDAAAEGELGMMRVLLNEDPCILDRVSYKKSTPLHVATMKGRLSLVQEILSCNPQLAEDLDVHQSSPLHVASGNGHLEIVRELLRVAPEMCLSKDCHGRNPVHVAAVRGQVEILKELVEKHPIAAREKTDGGLTVLHLCVKYQRLDALKELEPRLGDLLNRKDVDGNNILHMATTYNQVEIVEYLASNKNIEIDIQAKNLQGQTAWEILKQIPKRDPNLLAKLKPRSSKEEWLTEYRQSVMVVAILIATMTFQAGVTPPGGILQDALTLNNITFNNTGEAVVAFTHPPLYKAFMYVNSSAFVMSLSTILLLTSGLPFKKEYFMWILIVIMWVTITLTAVTYAISITIVTAPKKNYDIIPQLEGQRKSLINVIIFGMISWISLMTILFACNIVVLGNRWFQRKKAST